MSRTINAVKVCVLCAAVSVTAVFADTIELRNAAPVLNATVVGVTDQDVRFKIAGGDVLYSLQKSQISRILYSNGAVETYGAPAAQMPPPHTPAQQPMYNPPPPPPPVQQPMYNTQPAHQPPPPVQQPMYGTQPVYNQPTQPAPQPPHSTQPTAGQAAGGAAADDDDETSSGGVNVGIRGAFSGYNGFTSISDYGERLPVGWGWGASAGVEVSIPISNSVAFKPELSFTYRFPSFVPLGNIDEDKSTKKEVKLDWEGGYSVREFAVCVPLLLQANLTGDRKFFAEIGVEIDLAFGTNMYIDYYDYGYEYDPTTGYQTQTKDDKKTSESVNISDLRTIPDFGIVYGFGFHLTKKCKIGIRHITYINSAVKVSSMFFNQTGIGLTLLFL